MDLARLAQLKELILHTRELSNVWEFFLDNFGESPEFIALGERARDPFLETVLCQVAEHLLGHPIDPNELLLTALPNHHFIHGGSIFDGSVVNVVYFDDVRSGVAIVIKAWDTSQTHYARFGVRPTTGIPKPSAN